MQWHPADMGGSKQFSQDFETGIFAFICIHILHWNITWSLVPLLKTLTKCEQIYNSKGVCNTGLDTKDTKYMPKRKRNVGGWVRWTYEEPIWAANKWLFESNIITMGHRKWQSALGNKPDPGHPTYGVVCSRARAVTSCLCPLKPAQGLDTDSFFLPAHLRNVGPGHVRDSFSIFSTWQGCQHLAPDEPGSRVLSGAKWMTFWEQHYYNGAS